VKQAVSQLPANYGEFLEELKVRIRTAQSRATLAVNRELIRLYWEVGRRIVARQQEEPWGRSVIERLAVDVQREFPGLKGFSPSNFWRMRAFYLAYSASGPFLAQPVREMGELDVPPAIAVLPWGHNVVLLEKLKDPKQQLWYAGQAVEHGWSRAMLVHQIESDLYRRQGRALTNFDRVLPPAQSDLARETLKDPYIFDFLSLGEEAQERDLERALLLKLRDFLLELGSGFALVGSQYHLEIDGQDFYLDLLFYHLRLRCYVVIELKVRELQPEHAGKMGFYLAAVDDLLRHPHDEPTIGLILCKTSSRVIAEYSLQSVQKPIGVASYRLMPPALKEGLPSPAELEKELGILESLVLELA